MELNVIFSAWKRRNTLSMHGRNFDTHSSWFSGMQSWMTLPLGAAWCGLVMIETRRPRIDLQAMLISGRYSLPPTTRFHQEVHHSGKCTTLKSDKSEEHQNTNILPKLYGNSAQSYWKRLDFTNRLNKYLQQLLYRFLTIMSLLRVNIRVSSFTSFITIVTLLSLLLFLSVLLTLLILLVLLSFSFRYNCYCLKSVESLERLSIRDINKFEIERDAVIFFLTKLLTLLFLKISDFRRYIILNCCSNCLSSFIYCFIIRLFFRYYITSRFIIIIFL